MQGDTPSNRVTPRPSAQGLGVATGLLDGAMQQEQQMVDAFLNGESSGHLLFYSQVCARHHTWDTWGGHAIRPDKRTHLPGTEASCGGGGRHP